MTIPVSTVPLAMAGLFNLIQNQLIQDPYSQQVLVYYGEPGMDLTDDMIEVGTTVRRAVKPQTFIGDYSLYALEEHYTIECLVSTWSGDPDPLASLNRAYTLVGYVETAVRTDPSLGSEVLQAFPAGTSGGQPVWTGGDNEDEGPIGRLCEITVMVDVTTLN
jgi:hypothetical protein